MAACPSGADLTEVVAAHETATDGTRSLIEALPLVVYTVSVGPDAEPRFIAPQVEELLGIPACSFTFERLRHGIHPADREHAFAAFDLADARGDELKIEYRFVRPDGSVVWIEDSSRVTPVGGELLAQGYLLDITQRKQAEQQLVRRAAVRRSVADIGRASAAGAAREEVIRMSFAVLEQGLRATAGSYLEIVGDDLVVIDCFGWDARGAVAHDGTPAGRARLSKAVVRTSDPAPAGRLLAAHGLQSSLAAPILLDDGSCVGALTVHSTSPDAFTEDDLSLLEQTAHLISASISRARRDERLRRSQRLEVVGQLAAGVAHDFNNLLTAIGGYTELARRTVDAHGGAHLDQVLRTTDRARILTSQLLAFSRKQVLRPQPLRLGEVVGSALPMLAPLLSERVRVRAEIEDVVVLADEAQLENVLVNLAVNAHDAMPEGGTLTIRTEVVDVRTEEACLNDVDPGPYGRLVVTDTGTGMAPDVLARIFEPFFTTKEQGRGTGLGLPSVDGIVRQTGGFVTVQSELGAGTSVFVHLPLSEMATTVAPERERVTVDGGTVLVVEDEEVVRLLLEEQLAELGLQVTSAATAAAALALLERHGFDLMLTDLGLPDMDGALLAAVVRERHAETRTLLMSGYPHDVVASRGIDPRVTLLQKPFRLDELEDAVGRALAD